MKVFFATNLDHYKTNCFPDNLTQVPRVGDHIQVVDVFHQHYKNKQLPNYLEVRSVLWTDKGVICELWYSELSVKVAKQNGTDIF